MKCRFDCRVKTKDSRSTSRAFTLIELVIVIAVIALVTALAASRLGTFDYWKEEGFIRRLSETIKFLHHQAISDQTFYMLEIDLENSSYRVGALKDDATVNNGIISDAEDPQGLVSLELSDYLTTTFDSEQTMIPPPSFPSLFEKQYLPLGATFDDVTTMRGVKTRRDNGTSYILFSPRGFSEFAVLHIRLAKGAPVTIFINSFTGLPQVYRARKEFKWQWDSKQRKLTS